MISFYKSILNFILIGTLFNPILSYTVYPVCGIRNSPAITKLNMNINRRDAIFKSLAYVASTCIITKPYSSEAFTMDEEQHIKLFEKINQSVCYISTTYNQIADKLDVKSNNIPKGVGTGFIWDLEGHIVTNFHVINKVDSATVTLTNKNGDTQEYVAKLTGVDPDKDIAVLKIDVKKTDNMELKPLEFVHYKDIKIGQYSFAIGNPFGLDHSISMGIISGKNRQITAPSGRKIKQIIQTDASINPGNSGGPLIDTDGKLIGMNTATMGMGVSAGVGFAISIDLIKKSVDDIIKNGYVQRAVLGISYLDRLPSKEEANKSGMPFIEYGVIISDVPKSSPAYSVGLIGIKNIPSNINATNNSVILGDVIVGLDKYKIADANDLMDSLDNYKPNDVIRLFTLRGTTKTPYIFDIKLTSFKMITFSGLENEKKLTNDIEKIDLPLKDLAPQIIPRMPNN
jgi:S1-C subfamily serine protease